MTITAVSPELAEAVARAIYESLVPHRTWDHHPSPEVRERYREAARAAIVTARFSEMVQRQAPAKG